jgi:hypothetical protein
MVGNKTMRIKKIQVNNYYNVEEFNCTFDKDKNVINIVESLVSDGEKFFNEDGDFLSAIKMLFNNDSCNKLRTRINKGTIVKCDIEHYGVDFTWGIKGHTARVETPEKILYGDTVLWVSECNNDKLENRKYPKSLFRYNTQEFFYPDICRDIMLFDKNSKIYDVLIDDEISLNEYSRQKGFELSVEKEAESFCREKELVYVDEDTRLMFTDDYEYLLGNKDRLIYDLTEEQRVFLYLYNWIQRLNVVANIYDKLGEENRYPVFVDGVLDKIHNEKMIEFIMEELRSTGRQVFIITHEKNEIVSKYTDQVSEIRKKSR